MTNLQRRVQKLEASSVDGHGLIPAGEHVDATGITLAVTDAIIEAADLADAASGAQRP
jgi:hypothetical protein